MLGVPAASRCGLGRVLVPLVAAWCAIYGVALCFGRFGILAEGADAEGAAPSFMRVLLHEALAGDWISLGSADGTWGGNGTVRAGAQPALLPLPAGARPRSLRSSSPGAPQQRRSSA